MEETTLTGEKTFNRRAYSICQGEEGFWQVVSIGYDQLSQEVGDYRVERNGVDKAEAIEYFKMAVSDNVFAV